MANQQRAPQARPSRLDSLKEEQEASLLEAVLEESIRREEKNQNLAEKYGAKGARAPAEPPRSRPLCSICGDPDCTIPNMRVRPDDEISYLEFARSLGRLP